MVSAFCDVQRGVKGGNVVLVWLLVVFLVFLGERACVGSGVGCYIF